MFNIADIILIVIIALAGFLGYKKGFIKTGFGFISFFLAVAITFMFYKPVMGIIKEQTGFEKWLTEYLNSVDLSKDESSKDDKNENETDNYLDNLPTEVVDFIGLEELKTNAKNTIIQKIVDFSVKLLAIVIVYIVARISLAILVFLLDLVAKLPVLKQFNEILGLITGVLLGLIRVYVILTIVTLISSLPVAHGIVELIQKSLLTSILYDNNLLLKLLF